MRTILTPKNIPEYIVIQHYLRGHNGILYEGHIKFYCGLAILEKDSYWHKKLTKSTKWKTYPLIHLYYAKKLKPKDVLAHFGPKIYAAYKIAYKEEADRIKMKRELKAQKLQSIKSVEKLTVNINKEDKEIEKRINESRCIAKTKKGNFCKGKVKKGSKYCVFHKKQEN